MPPPPTTRIARWGERLVGSDLRLFMISSLLILVSVSPLVSGALSIPVLAFLVVALSRGAELSFRLDALLGCLLSMFAIGAMYDLFVARDVSSYSLLNVYFPTCFIIGYLVARNYSIKAFMFSAERFVFLAAICSLVGMAVIALAPGVVSVLPEYTYYQTTHRTAGFFNVLVGPDGVVHRNAGIAWEPGVFQFILNLGLYAHLRGTAINVIKVFVYGLAILLTQSTVGLLIFALLLAKICLRVKWMLLAAPLILFLARDPIAEVVTYQLDYKWLGTYAFEGRLDAARQTVDMGRGQLLGLGNSGYAAQLGQFDPSWDSYGQILVRYGFPLLVAIVGLLILLAVRWPLLAAIIVLTLFSQGLWFAPLVTPFYFFAVQVGRWDEPRWTRLMSGRDGTHGIAPVVAHPHLPPAPAAHS